MPERVRTSMSPPAPPGLSPTRPLPRQLSSRCAMAIADVVMSVPDDLERLEILQAEDELVAGHRKMAHQRVAPVPLHDAHGDDDVLGAPARDRHAQSLPDGVLESIHLRGGPGKLRP